MNKRLVRWLKFYCNSFVALCLCGSFLAPRPCLAEISQPQQETAATASSTDGPVDSKELEAFTDRFFADRMEKLHIPGLVFTLVKDGKIFFSKGYGYADLEKKIPVVPDKTVFPIASVSKLFTATAVMQLVEKGKLNLNEDVNNYLKTFKLENNFPEPVTMANLLTHTGGFEDRKVGMYARSEAEIKPLGEYLAEKMPKRVMPPGKVLAYSNHGMALAGYIVETVSGVPFAQYVDENILKPLNMRRSNFLPLPELMKDRVTGYDYTGTGYQIFPFLPLHITPAVSMLSTATDMGNFMIAHLQKGRFEGTRILEEATAEEMQKQHYSINPQVPGYAYGFHEYFRNNIRAVEHSGFINSVASYLCLIPGKNIGFFISYNTYNLQLIQDMPKEFFDHYYPVQNGKLTPPTDFNSRADLFTGSYRGYIYSQTTFEKLTALFLEYEVLANSDGTLTINYPFGFFETSSRLVEIGPQQFCSLSSRDNFIFQEDASGHVTNILFKWGMIKKLSWYETASFQVVFLGITLLLFLSASVIWPIVYLARRLLKKGDQSPQTRMSQLAKWTLALTGGLNLLFIVMLQVLFIVMPLDLYFGVPGIWKVTLLIPILTTVLAILLPFFTVEVWRKSYLSPAGRVHYSLVTLAALAFIPFLIYWNLLGMKY